MNHDLNPLSDFAVIEKLADFPGWKYENNKISKTFEFKTFDDGLSLVNELAPFCNKIDHHPDILIRYKKIEFSLTRFSVGFKVTERDFKVAQQIEELYRKYL